jgi:hypothetical protein
MIKSANLDVQNFIDNIMMLDNPKHQTLLELRKIVFENFPKVKERIMYGGIIFSLDDDFGGVFVYKNHISFEFSYGYKFKDPDKQLEGKGKYRRHLKIRSGDDIEIKKVAFFVKQISTFD